MTKYFLILLMLLSPTISHADDSVTVILLIQKKGVEPTCVDPGNCTAEEQTAIDNYNQRVTWYNEFQDKIAAWEVLGDHEDFINENRSAIVVKSGVTYLLATVLKSRIPSDTPTTQAVKNWVSNRGGKVGACATSNVKAWLESRGWTYPESEE